MRYVMLIYETPSDFEARGPAKRETYRAAWRAYYRALVEGGAYVDGGAPLAEPGAAATVRVRDGRRHVQDGPFAETKDQLGGFVILECATLDDALAWAARCPVAGSGAVEVRPLAGGWHNSIVEG